MTAVTKGKLIAERDENVYREDFSPEEAVAIAKAVRPTERAAAKERQKEHGGTSPGKSKNTSPKLGGVSGDTDDKVAEFVGMGRTSLARAEAIVDARDAEPEKYQLLVDEMNKTGRVNGVFKKLKTAQTAAVIKAETPPLPDGQYRVIVVDPPWKYGNRSGDVSHRASDVHAGTRQECRLLLAGRVFELANRNALLEFLSPLCR